MYFIPQAATNEIEYLITTFKKIIEWKTLETRLNDLNRQSQGVHSFYIKDRFHIELTLLEIFKYYKNTGRYPWSASPAQHKAYSFITMVVKVYEQLSNKGKIRLKGMLRNSLNKDYGFNPLAFEMLVATNLMQSGFDVDFTDLEGKERFDFLATKNGKSLEVECKFISADIGRKIHQKKLHDLASHLQKTIDSHRKNTRENILVSIELEDRLNQEQINKILPNLPKALNNLNTLVQLKDLSIRAENFSEQESPFRHEVNIDNLRKFVKSKLKIENPHAFISYNPNHNAFVLSANSKRPDQVLETIFSKLLEDSKSQLSKQRPSLVCAFLADITEEQLLLMHKEQKQKNIGLQIISNKILERRPHVHTLAFMAEGSVFKSKLGNLTSYRHQGSVFSFTNPQHPSAQDEDFKIYK